MIADSPKRYETNVLSLMQENEYEHINFFHDKKTGLRAIIAIHSTKLGPALGGCRFYPYKDESSALKDVMRLSRAMTYKAAVSGLALGGGKSVIMGDPKTLKNQEILEAFGHCIERLNGKYITSVDSGTSDTDLDHIKKSTSYVVGASSETGGSGDPSPVTAIGVFEGIKACLQKKFKDPSPHDKVIAVQGLGHVGFALSKLLFEAGAKLVVADINEDQISRCEQEFGAKRVSTETILSTECDVLAPCAMGGVINPQTIPQLNTGIIAGAANNQLSLPEVGKTLLEKNIIYAPDFVINAGGLINVDQERHGYDSEKAIRKTREIFNTVLSIVDRSKKENTPTVDIAIKMAKERLNASQ